MISVGYVICTICLPEMKHWMSANLLMLNKDKTEILVFGNSVKVCKVMQLAVGYLAFNIKSSCRNLVVIFF